MSVRQAVGSASEPLVGRILDATPFGPCDRGATPSYLRMHPTEAHWLECEDNPSDLSVSPANPNVSDDSGDPICVKNRYDSDTPPSIAIVQAIAAIEDVDPMNFHTDLGIRLYDHVDPTALDRLVTETDGSNTVTVELTIHDDHRYSVRVRDTGRVVVEKIV